MTKHRTRILSLAMLLALACNERTIDSHEIPTDPLCMYAGGTTGIRADGTSSYILRSEGSGHPYVCACTTEEQYEDEAEFLRVREELNDRLLEECVRVANARGFVSNACELDHELGAWMDWWWLFVGDEVTMPFYDFSCGGEGWIPESDPEPICELGEPGCSCTVEGICTGGTTCIHGMCQPPP